MAERRCQKVHCRSQAMLLPPCMDDYVSEHNTVRAIDAFVGTLDLRALGFEHTEATRGAGQPAFDPALLPSCTCTAANTRHAVRAGWKRRRDGTWR